MKTMKKLFALLLAVLMVMGMATTAMAEDYTITINNESKHHRYEAYQVFGGTLSATGVLSDVEWGSGVNGDALLAALKVNDLFLKGGVNQFAGCSDAASVAKVVAGWSTDDTVVKDFADAVSAHLTGTFRQSTAQTGKYVITVPAAGYYFIKDADAVTGNNVISDYMLYVVKSLEISPKVSTHTFKKTVNHELGGTYVEALDAQVGDLVYFKLETKLPGRFHDYKQYVMYIQDVLPEGLTFNRMEAIYVAHADSGVAQTDYYTAAPGDTDVYEEKSDVTTGLTDARKFGFSGNTLTVNFGDLKITQTNPNLNDTITVKYSAYVNKDAVYGKNVTTMVPDGTNGNTNTATVYFTNDMNKADGQANGYLSDTANVYTYQLEVTKQDSVDESKKLQGAEFVLIRNYSTTGGPSITKYAVLDANNVVSNWVTDKAAATVLQSDASGKFVVKGLDSLIYHLEEIKAPEGYNKMEDKVLVTVAGDITGHELTGLNGSADSNIGTGTVDDGKLAVIITNNPGNVLPATGGIGTTIFYIVGGVLVLGAAAAFVMKRRNEEA